MKARYKDLFIEGSPDECYIFYIMTRFEKKVENDLRKSFEAEEQATKKRDKIVELKSLFKNKKEGE
jgi:hypothetical protein